MAYNIEDLKKYYKTMLDKKRVIDNDVATLRGQIAAHYEQEIGLALANKPEPFGTVTIDDIEFNIPKRVKWNQDGLAKMYKQIGRDADQYIKVKYEVSESKFKSWPEAWRKDFAPYREVVEGAITVKFRSN